MKVLSTPSDSHQIFGDYVADALRNMTEFKSKKLKITIQKAIVKMQEEPDDVQSCQAIITIDSSSPSLTPDRDIDDNLENFNL